MGISIFNTPQRDDLLQWSQSMQDAGVKADNAIEIPQIEDADFIHDGANTYFCDVRGGSITCTIPYEQDVGFKVYDAYDAMTGPKEVTLEFLDSDNVTVRATYSLDSRNRNWSVFKINDFWYVVRNDRGEVFGPF